uniref:Uncharacterized protein n=1 Tax=Anopheles farauti TaxID=69004 RepID=A0A182QAU0_9DIPT
MVIDTCFRSEFASNTMTTNRLHKVFLYSLAISLIAIFITLASKVFPIANLPLSTNLIIVGTCLANFASVIALIIGIVTRRPRLVKIVKIFSYIQLGAIFVLICLAAALLYFVKVDVEHTVEPVSKATWSTGGTGIGCTGIIMCKFLCILIAAGNLLTMAYTIYTILEYTDEQRVCGLELIIVSSTLETMRKKLNPVEGTVVYMPVVQVPPLAGVPGAMLTNRAFRILTYLFGSINVFFVLVILSMGAEQLLVDWRTAIYELVIPCALNIIFAMCWMIGAGLWRPTLIAMFKYFTYVQMALLAAVILYSAYYSYVKGISSNLLTVISLLTSLFFLSLMEVLIAIGTERAIAKERHFLRLTHTGQEMSDWSHT